LVTETAIKPKLKLELACGQHVEDGWTGVDIAATDAATIVHDLLEFPWPFEDESVDEARISHFIEHIPHLCFHCRKEQDPFYAFFDELHRVLVPGGTVKIIVPYYTSGRAWQDPTHRRAITEATFAYLNREWRESQKLDHYPPVLCNFEIPPMAYNIADEWLLRQEETARTFAVMHYNNVALDLVVTLIKR
jgi:predicted SAM-dependent methyltransferase